MAFHGPQIDSKLNWSEQINALSQPIYVIRTLKNYYTHHVAEQAPRPPVLSILMVRDGTATTKRRHIVISFG